MPNPLLKFLAGQSQDIEQEIDRGPRIMFAFVPPLRVAYFEDFVITLLVLFDKSFETDIRTRSLYLKGLSVHDRVPSVNQHLNVLRSRGLALPRT